MHQTDILGSKPRFLRASLLTGVAAAALPSIFFVFAYVDFISPQWDAANDSGIVQGYFFLGVSSVLAVMFALVAFPAIAFLLGTSSLAGVFWGRCSFFWLFCPSVRAWRQQADSTISGSPMLLDRSSSHWPAFLQCRSHGFGLSWPEMMHNWLPKSDAFGASWLRR